MTDYTREQIDVIKNTVAKGATDDELAFFLFFCKKTGLDPFSRQIYLSERKAKINDQWVTTRRPETTIDGFRLIAERTQKYAGQLGPFWCGQDGNWLDVWLKKEPPVAAKVGILKTDFREPLFAVALYQEFVQTTRDGAANSMWQKMPSNQLAKCAESLALRKAFPNDLSGLYTKEEMEQSSNETPVAGALPGQSAPTQRQLPQRASAPASGPVIDAEAVAPAAPQGAAPPDGNGKVGVKVTIANVSSRKGTTNGKDWTIYEITSSAGEVYKTFNSDIFKAAEILKGKNVTLLLETNPKNNRVTISDILHDGDDMPAGDEGDEQPELA